MRSVKSKNMLPPLTFIKLVGCCSLFLFLCCLLFVCSIIQYVLLRTRHCLDVVPVLVLVWEYQILTEDRKKSSYLLHKHHQQQQQQHQMLQHRWQHHKALTGLINFSSHSHVKIFKFKLTMKRYFLGFHGMSIWKFHHGMSRTGMHHTSHENLFHDDRLVREKMVT